MNKNYIIFEKLIKSGMDSTQGINTLHKINRRKKSIEKIFKINK